MTRRLAVVVLGAVALLAAIAVPADADPAGPTHFRSELTRVVGPSDGIEAAVFGGDSFLVLTVAPGREVVVPGYEEGELYLRYAPDGSVYVNTRGLTHYQNQDRYQQVDIPPEASPEAPPRWELVANGGTYAWHDHRIHWMSPALPPQVDSGLDRPQEVMPWLPVPVVVDGQPVALEGTVTWLPGSSPLVPAVLALAAFGLVVAASWRRPVAAGGLAVAIAGGGALMLGVGAWIGVPPGADAQPLFVVLPALALAAAAVGAVVARRRRGHGHALVALAGAPLVAWAITQSGALTRPLLPVAAPPALVRLAVALALGAGAGVVAAGIAAAWRVEGEAAPAAGGGSAFERTRPAS